MHSHFNVKPILNFVWLGWCFDYLIFEFALSGDASIFIKCLKNPGGQDKL